MATGCTISEPPKPHQAFDQLAQVVRHDRFFQIGPLGGVEKLFDLGAHGIAGDERQAGDLVRIAVAEGVSEVRPVDPLPANIA